MESERYKDDIWTSWQCRVIFGEGMMAGPQGRKEGGWRDWRAYFKDEITMISILMDALCTTWSDDIYCFLDKSHFYRIEHFHLDLAEGSGLSALFPPLSVVILRTNAAGTLWALLSPPGPPCPPWPPWPPALTLALIPTEVSRSFSEFFLLWRTDRAMSSKRVSTWSPDLEDVSSHLQPSLIALVCPASLLTWGVSLSFSVSQWMLSNLSEVLQVCLAANQDSLRVDVILLAPLAILKLLPPLLHTVECFPVCNIVGHHHRVRPPVVEGANWGELFLASRVPQISAVSRAQSETGSELDKSYYCFTRSEVWRFCPPQRKF